MVFIKCVRYCFCIAGIVLNKITIKIFIFSFITNKTQQNGTKQSIEINNENYITKILYIISCYIQGDWYSNGFIVIIIIKVLDLNWII